MKKRKIKYKMYVLLFVLSPPVFLLSGKVNSNYASAITQALGNNLFFDTLKAIPIKAVDVYISIQSYMHNLIIVSSSLIDYFSMSALFGLICLFDDILNDLTIKSNMVKWPARLPVGERKAPACQLEMVCPHHTCKFAPPG